MEYDIVNNTAASRYELEEQGHTAYADYQLDGGTLRLDYVYAPPELRGKGTAGRLMEGILAEAREQGLRILPICGYAASWLKRHASVADIIE